MKFGIKINQVKNKIKKTNGLSKEKVSRSNVK